MEPTPRASERGARAPKGATRASSASVAAVAAQGDASAADGAARPHSGIFASSPILREIAAEIERSAGVVTIGRAHAPGAAFLLGFLAASTRRPILAVAATPDEAERLRRNWSTFLDTPAEEFPLWESLFDADSEPDPETFAQRHGIAEAFAAKKSLCAVAPIQALLQPIARTKGGDDRRILLRRGDVMPPSNLARMLVDAGYRRFPQVARPGDFSLRGGIFDVYPREGMHPYRIDFLGDEIDSIRAVSLADQRSRDEVALVVFALLQKSEYFIRGYTGSEVTLLERLPKSVLLALAAPREVEEKCAQLVGQWAPRRAPEIASRFWAQAAHLTRIDLEPFAAEPGHRPFSLPILGTEQFQGALDRVCTSLRDEEARGSRIEVVFRQLAEVERFREILADFGVGPGCQAVAGDLTEGFRWQEQGTSIFLGGSAILGRVQTLAPKRARRVAPARAVESFLELTEGDFVVHVAHGIGRYRGVRDVASGRRRGDHLVVEFQENVHLLVPAERIDLVQKYVGGGASVALDRIGSRAWARRKERVEAAVHDLAAEMLEVQALRAERAGFAFPADNHFQEEFEQAFPYEETGDQLEAMAAIRADLESARPMDRLICGDVGYGKTELAMRAAFKVVQAGRQVAVLVPTTVLAQQHLVTFRDRMAEFPARIEALSRFRSHKEQLEILRRTHEGEVDILIGTHRMLSKDLSFKDLGLIIIDEEQRFGVAHKEGLKQLRRLVDILTLTATPIPRTLHLALLGVRDISSLMEAPEGRSPVHTEVCVFEPRRFREIILFELNRDGQVFFLHNRITTIEHRRRELEQLVPEARIVHIHGRMEEHELEERMGAFLEKRYDVLVTTTIIESGLDIPSANTLIVDRADRFGLAELHQLRGRVGRGRHKAHAYFLVPEDRPVRGDARDRLRAIEEYSSLGAGFQIALRDLEIRGAGNILGREQSGHIATVGYDLYCRLLERAVAKLRGAPWTEPPDIDLAVPGHCGIPENYVGDAAERLRIYRAAATALDEGAIADVEEGLTDRYGELPAPARNLIQLQRLRLLLARWGVRRAGIEDGWLMVEGNEDGIRRGLAARSWEVVALPEGVLGARPRRGATLATLEDLSAALLDAGVRAKSEMEGNAARARGTPSRFHPDRV
ncbi:MAG: transcription-repair coupling factor [Planctomycetes bacterium]|nr:transcription-repair coupling factor [Planctomycetota bacterium]